MKPNTEQYIYLVAIIVMIIFMSYVAFKIGLDEIF